MFQKPTMKRLLVCLCLTAFWVAGFQANWTTLSLALPDIQSDCVEQVIGNAEIVANQAVDIDQDGKLDQIILYINDKDDRTYDPIYVLIALYQSPMHCRAVLNEELTLSKLTTDRQTITVRRIEMVELTGDNRPELHIWLDRSGGGPRASVAYHAVFTLVDRYWKHALGNKGVEQCLAFSSFEFREAPGGDAKDIYLDEDRHCEPPWSSDRTYAIMRWNGSKFVPVEEGTIDISTTDPPWLNVCCVATLVGPVVVLVLVTRLRRKRITAASTRRPS
jgi:hypothetical protein